MTFVNGDPNSSEEIAELLAAMGIDKKRVAGFTINCRPHAAASVTVEIYLEKDDLQSISGKIKRYYKLVPA